MSFDDIRFPDRIARGAIGGPEWNTSIVVTTGGHEVRNQNWSQSRGRWNISPALQSVSDIRTILAFFRARRGRLRAFRFKDWSDYVMERQQIGTTNGTQATFQIFKRYSSGPSFHDRTINLPVSGTVRCWVNNVERTLGTGSNQFQVNTTTGVITLGSSLASSNGWAVEVECEFDVPVRFESDLIEAQLETMDFGQFPSIYLVEVRL